MRFPKGQCQLCGKTDERTKAGRYYCAECAANHNKHVMEKYYQRIAEHRCGACGDQDERTLNGRIQCAPCAKFHAAKVRAKYRDKKKAAGNGNSQAAKAKTSIKV